MAKFFNLTYIDYGAAFPNITSKLSMSAWVYPTVIPVHPDVRTFLSNGNASTGRNYVFDYRNVSGTTYLEYSNGVSGAFGEIRGTVSLTPETWSHVGFTVDLTTNPWVAQWYVNGSTITTNSVGAATTGTPSNSDSNGTVGNLITHTVGWRGGLAEVATWDGALLTASEIAALARGYSPSRVRLANLSIYPQLLRDVNDRKGAAGTFSTTEPLALLLHGNGADASTTFTDSSANNHTITASGNAQIDTAQSVFGGASILLDGTGDYLTTPDSSTLATGTGPFTWDFWIRWNDRTGQQNPINPVAGGGIIYKATDHTIRLYSGSDLITGTTAVANNTWYHIAVVRTADSNIKLYINGVQEGSTFASGGVDWGNQWRIGSDAAGHDVNGWMDDVRFVPGVALWSSNFTPPTTEAGTTIEIAHPRIINSSTQRMRRMTAAAAAAGFFSRYYYDMGQGRINA